MLLKEGRKERAGREMEGERGRKIKQEKTKEDGEWEGNY